MWNRIKHALAALDLEERILNGSTLASLIFLFFPWLSGETLSREHVTYSGLQSYVSYLGWSVLLLHFAILLMTLLPLAGLPSFVRREWKMTVRLWLSTQAAVLILASLSVLARVTYEYTAFSIRYGVYFSLVGALIATLYSFLQWQEERATIATEVFHHPEDTAHHAPSPQPEIRMHSTLPPPPPPPPLPPEDHNNLRL